MAVDGPLVGLEAEPVDGVEQLRPRPDAAGLPGEGREQLELGRRERDVATRDGHPVADRVELEVAGDDPLVGEGRGLDAAEHGADPGDELARAERLDHVVVGAELEAGDPVDLVAAGREDQDRDARVAADRADDVEAVDARQAEVEDERVGPPGPGEREGRGSVGGADDREPRVLEVVADEARDLRLVLDDEDRAHGSPNTRSDAGRGYPPGVAGREVSRPWPAPLVGGAGGVRPAASSSWRRRCVSAIHGSGASSGWPAYPFGPWP